MLGPELPKIMFLTTVSASSPADYLSEAPRPRSNAFKIHRGRKANFLAASLGLASKDLRGFRTLCLVRRLFEAAGVPRDSIEMHRVGITEMVFEMAILNRNTSALVQNLHEPVGGAFQTKIAFRGSVS